MTNRYLDYSLFFLTALIWGSTWIAIKFQLGVVPEAWSVVYRFGLASAILYAYCCYSKRSLKFTFKQHISIALQGLFLFCINYLLFYYGSEHLFSGIVALLFSSVVVGNLFNSWLFLGSRITLKTLMGSALGLGGIALTIFFELNHLSNQGPVELQQYSAIGFILCFIASYSASLGNIVATRNQRQGLPVVQTNCLGMAYGAGFALILNLLQGDYPVFDYSLDYMISLFYLALFGSVFAFGAYVRLLHRLGPERAVYTFVLVPFVAMLISSYFEGFVWDMTIIGSLLLVAVGNVLVLSKQSR